MLDNPIIKNMYFTLLKHVITSTVAFVTNSEFKKNQNHVHILYKEYIIKHKHTKSAKLHNKMQPKNKKKIKITFYVISFQNHCMFISCSNSKIFFTVNAL